ncbi:MAG: hypothetical protein AAF944_07290 [Bacteroidota bacterium]
MKTSSESKPTTTARYLAGWQKAQKNFNRFLAEVHRRKHREKASVQVPK